MKLETKFFNVFFYPFFIGVLISIIMVVLVLSHYTKGFLDERTAVAAEDLETKYARNNIYSVNILIYNLILKAQQAIEEQLSYFQFAEKNLNLSEPIEKRKIRDVYNVFETPDSNSELKKRLDYASLWFVDKNLKDPKENEILYNQIYLFSLLSQSMYISMESLHGLITKFYFIFEDTNVFLAYPYKEYYKEGSLKALSNYTKNPSWCTDDSGNIIDYYRFKCRPYYRDIVKAKSTLFDNNYQDQKNRKLFVTSPYVFLTGGNTASFTMCLQFNYTISNTDAYACVDIEGADVFNTLNKINQKLIGYFTISAVGFNEQFYFPNIITLGTGKALVDYIFNWDIDFYLEEKKYFLTTVQKQMTSNYAKNYIDKFEKNRHKDSLNVFDEVYIDNEIKGKDQFFYVDEVLYEFDIFPIFLTNTENELEHVLSIIYIYNEQAFFEYLLDYESDTYNQLPLQLILFAFFGSILLYIIVLSFKILAKFIVIPIKNVNYMLEGINIGGEYRLEFLGDLKKKQEDNLEKLNIINKERAKRNKDNNDDYIKELIKDKINNKNNNNDTINIKQNNLIDNSNGNKDNENINNINNNNITNSKTKSNLMILTEDNNIKKNILNERAIKKNLSKKIDNKNNKDNKEDSSINDDMNNLIEDENINNIDNNIEIYNPKINYDQQYDLEGDKIEKELNFYDFDEELLQYRPLEVDRLVRSLLNLKSALLLTSSEQNIENIIGYSNSDYIFSNFKNKAGSRLCQSNIGNLESQLYKYDKAIYHLALSLQTIELKKFLSQALSDELDDGDILLHKLEMSYEKDIKGKELNKLVKKQQRTGYHKKILQNFIETLINSRYNKLINFYYKFFSSIKKLKYNYEKLGGLYAHTDFHTINNYHKILIQYIYLCFVSNDLVKIGESILDYVEFLIKFKLKTAEENNYILNINNKDIQEINTIQLNKKKYFNKIINWLNLFDNYAKQITENSALGNFKDILEAYIHNMQSNQSDLDSGNQSALLFQVNLQRCDFLKGKFALACKNYSDALGFFITASKKKRIVTDGLIKKRALKKIKKITEKTKQVIASKNISTLNYSKIIENIGDKNGFKINIKKSNLFKDNNDINKNIKLIDKIKELMNQVDDDINETNEKQLKDIVILIDCNLSAKLTVDSYIDVVKTILKNYLTNEDRLGVFLLEKEQKIFCPMESKKEIDINNFSKDLDITIENLFKKEKIELISFNEINKYKKEEQDIYIDKNIDKDSFTSEGSYINDKGITTEEMIKALNYCLAYLKMKEISTNEKYFIFFNTNMKTLMDYLSINKLKEKKEKNKNTIKKEKKINFLLVGKIDKEKQIDYNNILFDYFGNKSEVIPFDNMKKLKSILSSNNIINDNITFPNEVYKG